MFKQWALTVLNWNDFIIQKPEKSWDWLGEVTQTANIRHLHCFWPCCICCFLIWKEIRHKDHLLTRYWMPLSSKCLQLWGKRFRRTLIRLWYQAGLMVKKQSCSNTLHITITTTCLTFIINHIWRQCYVLLYLHIWQVKQGYHKHVQCKVWPNTAHRLTNLMCPTSVALFAVVIQLFKS